MTWVQTVSGIPFDLLDPKPDMVRVEDIAHALSRIARFNGHTHGEPYSVAHHSMLVADLLASWGAPPAIVREGELHDAAESSFGDTVSPVQRAARVMIQARLLEHLERGVLAWGPHGYQGEIDALDRLARELDPLRQLRERIEPVFRRALGLPEHETPIVKRADLVALAIERRDLFGSCERDWHLGEFAPTSAPCGRIAGRFTSALAPSERRRIDAADLCTWDAARDRFLALLRELDVSAGFEPATAEAA